MQLVVINNIILITALLLSVIFDITQKRIPNFITLPVMGWGLLSYSVTGGFSGIVFSFLGLLLGLGVFIIPYMLGGMGGGDVKLMAAIGALKGTEFVFFATLFTAIIGAFMAIIYLLIKGRLFKTIKNSLAIVAVPFFNALAFRFKAPIFYRVSSYFLAQRMSVQKENTPAHIPYGLAIAGGTLVVLSKIAESIIPYGKILGH